MANGSESRVTTLTSCASRIRSSRAPWLGASSLARVSPWQYSSDRGGRLDGFRSTESSTEFQGGFAV